MEEVKAVVLRGSGLNCNNETEHALKLAGASVEQAHMSEFVSGKKNLDGFQIMVIPGGFSFGDDLGAGRIMASALKHSLKKEMEAFVDEGRLLVGICNGFQVLVKTGFLPGNCNATLTGNDSGHFEDRWVLVKSCVENIFTRGISSLYIPVNHGEGRFVADDDALSVLNRNRQVALKYCDSSLNETQEYPLNPNGSVQAIAAVTNEKGNVFGMMPHPEKFVSMYQHPRWTREALPEEGDGLRVFRNMVKYAEESLV